MREPVASRPFMPGYGVVDATAGRGLLPWSWAVERLTSARDYWLATTWPDGRPHVMPVWGMWFDDALWFSCSGGSRKTRNLTRDPRCVVTTDHAPEPVVLEGVADLVTDPPTLARVLAAENEKYGTDYPIEFLDPAVNATFGVRPTWVFGIVEDEFTTSPTRWTFSA